MSGSCAYLINGNNYFKLRDIAYQLRGTSKQFQVTYDGLSKEVFLYSGMAYTNVGGEMTVTDSTASVTATPTPFAVYLNGRKLSLSAFVIGTSNYVKLRDIAAAIDFGVMYAGRTDTILIDTQAQYIPDKPNPAELSITLVGDSIGLDVEPYLRDIYPKLVVDSKVSRQFYEGVDVVQGLLDSGSLGQAVVIELGTNGDIEESDMRTIIELLGANRKIVFVNIQVDRSWCAGDNRTLSRVALDYPNVFIADWYSASIGQDDYFYSDMVHPNHAGSLVLAKVISDAVNR